MVTHPVPSTGLQFSELIDETHKKNNSMASRDKSLYWWVTYSAQRSNHAEKNIPWNLLHTWSKIIDNMQGLTRWLLG